MKEGYVIKNSTVCSDFADYILVCNYHVLNEIFNCCLSSRFGIEKTKNTVGVWKLKK